MGTFVLDEGIDIFDPMTEKNRLLTERITLNIDSEKAIQIDYIIDHFDEYWNKKAQINQISRNKSKWSKFYESYQENNDNDEIVNNLYEGFDKIMSELSEKWRLLDETTPQGNLAKKMSDAMFNGIEFWQGYNEYMIYDWIPQNIEYYKDGIEQIVDGLKQFGKNWLSGIEIIQNKITNGIVRKTKSKTDTARITRYDPLILDLDGDGFNVEKKELGANFDLDKNGFAEKINWTIRYNLKRKRGFDMIL